MAQCGHPRRCNSQVYVPCLGSGVSVCVLILMSSGNKTATTPEPWYLARQLASCAPCASASLGIEEELWLQEQLTLLVLYPPLPSTRPARMYNKRPAVGPTDMVTNKHVSCP